MSVSIFLFATKLNKLHLIVKKTSSKVENCNDNCNKPEIKNKSYPFWKDGPIDITGGLCFYKCTELLKIKRFFINK